MLVKWDPAVIPRNRNEKLLLRLPETTDKILIKNSACVFKITVEFLKHSDVLSFPDCEICSILTVYPKKYAHGFCFAVLCCGYTLTGFPISIRLTSLALWQSNDCPSASKATLMNMDKYFMWIHYERLHNHNKAKHNKTVCIFLGIYCILLWPMSSNVYCGYILMKSNALRSWRGTMCFGNFGVNSSTAFV